MTDDLRATRCAALGAFHFEVQRILDSTERRLRQAGLQRLPFLVLVAIKSQPPNALTTVRTLTDSMGLNRNSVIELVAALVQRGLVARRRDWTDRRRFLISLTPTGEEWLAPLVDDDVDAVAASGHCLLRALQKIRLQASAQAARLSVPTSDQQHHIMRRVNESDHYDFGRPPDKDAYR